MSYLIVFVLGAAAYAVGSYFYNKSSLSTKVDTVVTDVKKDI